MRDARGGLAQMYAPTGTLISYATQPGNVAADGKDGHSPYTEALAAAMQQPGLGVFEVFNTAAVTVKNETGGDQQPWVSNSRIEGTFYFVAPVTVHITPAPDPEVIFWQSVSNSSNAADFDAYLSKYPNGQFTDLAKNRIAALRAAATPPPPPPDPEVVFWHRRRQEMVRALRRARPPASPRGAEAPRRLELRDAPPPGDPAEPGRRWSVPGRASSDGRRPI
jgi:hypothetical protein